MIRVLEVALADVIGGELHFASVPGSRQFGQSHDGGIVDQHVHRLGVEPGNEVPDGHQIGDVEGRRLDSRIPGGFGYLIRDLAPGVELANCEDDVSTGSRQSACGLHPDARGGTGDGGTTAGQVDSDQDIGSGRGESERVVNVSSNCSVRIQFELRMALTTSPVQTTPCARKA